MDKYKREISIEVLVGLFIFTVLIALGVFTIVLSRESFFRKSYQYEIVFKEVSGLREGDNIFLRGVNVGRVKQIAMENGQVRVYASLDVPMQLYSGFRIEVINSSLLGGKNLKIYEGESRAADGSEKPLIDLGNTTIYGETPSDVIEELAKAVKGLQDMINSVNRQEGTLGKLLNDDTIYDNLVSVSDQLKVVSERLANGEGTVGKLLKDDTIYNDIASVSDQLKVASERLANGEGTIGKLLKDETVYNDVQQIAANLREISDRIAAGEGIIGKLVSPDGETNAIEDLEATLKSVRSIVERVEAGEGTLGKLVQDAKLYDEATLLVEDMRAAIDDLREASPITSFSSVVFGAF